MIDEKDLARWANAQRWATDTFGLPPSDSFMMQTTRSIYHDPEGWAD